MNGRQAEVARRHAVVPDLLQMVQVVTNRLGAQVFQGQADASFALMPAGKLQQQLQRIPIRQDGMGTEAPLGDQVLLKEAANGDREVSVSRVSHGVPFDCGQEWQSGYESACPRFRAAPRWPAGKPRSRSRCCGQGKWRAAAAWSKGSRLGDATLAAG